MQVKNYKDTLKNMKGDTKGKLDEIQKKYNKLMNLDKKLMKKVEKLEKLVEKLGKYEKGKKVKGMDLDNETIYRLSCISTYGNTFESEITDRIKEIGWEDFVDEQLEMEHKNIYHIYEISTEEPGRSGTNANHWRKAWYATAIFGEEQLMTKVGQALSEFFLVSEHHPRLSSRGYALAYYHQILVDGIEGTFKDLLFNVSNSAVMCEYLSVLGSMKEESTGLAPNEDYAREVMQLLSCGMVELNKDGTEVIGQDGNPVYTYTQKDVSELARVFTGVEQFGKTVINTNRNGNYHKPVIYFESEHDRGIKDVMDIPLPGDMDTAEEMRVVTDHLADMQETAVRFCMHMINRFMTSTPSLDIVEDIVGVFEETGGNIKAIVRAILLHPEQTNPTKVCNKGRIRSFMEAFIAGERGLVPAQCRLETYAFSGRLTDTVEGEEIERVMFENYTMEDRETLRLKELGGIYSAQNVFGILQWDYIPEELSEEEIGTPHKFVPELGGLNFNYDKVVYDFDYLNKTYIGSLGKGEIQVFNYWKDEVIERIERDYDGDQKFQNCHEAVIDIIEDKVLGGAKFSEEFREAIKFQKGGSDSSYNSTIHKEIIGIIIASAEWLVIGGR